MTGKTYPPLDSVVVIRKASAYEILIVALSAVAATVNLISPGTQSRVLADALGAPAATSYYIGLIVGGVAVVAGWALTERALRSDRHSPTVGLIIERAGLWLLGPLLVAYAFAVWLGGTTGAYAGAIAFAVGVAHLMRAFRIRTDIAAMRALATAALAASA